MKSIVLIGMPASGKSTIGVVVAKHLGYDFIDTDLLIQKQEKRLLKNIIEDKGIEGFLKIENQVNCSVNSEDAVIAPGGSVIYCSEAMEYFSENTIVLYLQVSFETIEERIADTAERGIVLKKGQTLKVLYDERVTLFERYAQITVCEDKLTLDETIDKVLKVLKKSEKISEYNM